MPVRLRAGSPYYHYSFTIDGRRFRGSTGCTSKREAEEVERDQYQLAKKNLAPQRDWTLKAVIAAYWSEHAKHKASHADILAALDNLERLIGKDKKTTALTGGDLMDYRAKRRGERLRGKAPKDYSINREFAYLHAAYQHCARNHRAPMPDIDWKNLRAKEPPWRTRFLSRGDEAPEFLASFPPHAREIVIAAIVTGLRRGNLFRLDWTQVRLSERLMVVGVKGGKELTVTIPPALMAILSTKTNRKGRVFDGTNFRRHWKAALEAAGLVDFRFHDLRHTFASWARKAGVDLPTLKEAMRHSDISMTMRYANVTPDEVETAFDTVSATLLGTISGAATEKTAGNGGKSND